MADAYLQDQNHPGGEALWPVLCQAGSLRLREKVAAVRYGT